jgi:hypothetical protein
MVFFNKDFPFVGRSIKWAFLCVKEILMRPKLQKRSALKLAGRIILEA